KALLPPEKALQLLAYDPHAGAFTVARTIVRKPPNPAAKREALRLLSADTKAASLFEKILLDKNEEPEYRQLSAAAPQGPEPDTFHERARETVMDESEHPDVQATCLTALTHFGDRTALAKDQKLLERVGELRKEKSAQVKQTARQFLSKYGQ